MVCGVQDLSLTDAAKDAIPGRSIPDASEGQKVAVEDATLVAGEGAETHKTSKLRGLKRVYPAVVLHVVGSEV